MAITPAQEKVLTWAAVVGIAAYAIYKLKDQFGFGSTFNPTDIKSLSSAWNDTPLNHSKYTYTMKSAEANNLSEDIYSTLGAFSDNFVQAFSDFLKCKTQGDVYQVSQFFLNNYDANLWASMVNGFGAFPWSGFSNEHLKKINDYVLTLPL